MHGKKILAILSGFALALVAMFGIQAFTSINVAPNASAGSTASQNLTEMIDALVPSFVTLMFVMALMMLLVGMVDRIGSKKD